MYKEWIWYIYVKLYSIFIHFISVLKFLKIHNQTMTGVRFFEPIWPGTELHCSPFSVLDGNSRNENIYILIVNLFKIILLFKKIKINGQRTVINLSNSLLLQLYYPQNHLFGKNTRFLLYSIKFTYKESYCTFYIPLYQHLRNVCFTYEGLQSCLNEHIMFYSSIM